MGLSRYKVDFINQQEIVDRNILLALIKYINRESYSNIHFLLMYEIIKSTLDKSHHMHMFDMYDDCNCNRSYYRIFRDFNKDIFVKDEIKYSLYYIPGVQYTCFNRLDRVFKDIAYSGSIEQYKNKLSNGYEYQHISDLLIKITNNGATLLKYEYDYELEEAFEEDYFCHKKLKNLY